MSKIIGTEKDSKVNVFASFETEIIIRPDDIDLNNHLHSTKYFDYVLYARLRQMKL